MQDYFNPHHEQMVQWKHAVIGDKISKFKISKLLGLHAKITTSGGTTYRVTLENCECSMFQKNQKPCVHMMKLALETGIYDEIKDVAMEKIRSLSDRAFLCFSDFLYYGYYEEKHKAEKYPQKIFREISEQNLIEFNNPEFEYSNFTKENIIAVIYATFSDPRYKR